MRPRTVPAKFCMTCRRTAYASPEDRQRVAEHRLEHSRADKRRKQWRDYGVRKRARARGDAAVGYLHNLGCSGGHYDRRGECRPIPVYSKSITEAA